MRHHYVGDIGDFANNGLLRVICGTRLKPVPDMRLGIIWYLNEPQDKYGNEIGYLTPSDHNRQTYSECDPGLYLELQKLVGFSMEKNRLRRISDTINSFILPPNTQHYDKPLPVPASKPSRGRWFNEALAKTYESNVIFLNPDIGIDWDRKARLRYVHRWEIQKLLDKDKILNQSQGGMCICRKSGTGLGVSQEGFGP